MSEKQKPTAEVRIGKIKSTIWRNVTKEGRAFYSLEIMRSYQDHQSGEWKEAHSFTYADLFILAAVINHSIETIEKLTRAEDHRSN